MSKVDLRRLDSLSHNDTAATKTINDNFQALKEAVEDSLSRTGKTPNYMDAELDMNSRRIINGGAPVEDGDYVTLKYFKDEVGNAKEYSNQAKASADLAESHALNAAIANKNAQNHADDALDSEVKCGVYATEVKEIADRLKEVNINREVYTNVPVTSADFWYEVAGLEYPWPAHIHLRNATGDDDPALDLVPTVVFNDAQAISGNFSTVAKVKVTHTGNLGQPLLIPSLGVEIYAKEPVTEGFNILTIKLD